MTQRLNIPYPFGGISDRAGFEDQDDLTTRDAQNVRGIDPITGRRRGGQRSGLQVESDLTTLGALSTTKVQDLRSITYDQPKIVYTAKEGTDPTADPGAPGDDEIEWSALAPSKDGVLWIDTDSQNNAYVLEADGSVSKYNSDGEELWSYGVSAPSGATVAPRLQLDASGNIYVAAADGDGKNSTVWRLERDEDNEVKEAHSWRVSGAVADFGIFANGMYLASERASGTLAWTLELYVLINTTAPTLAWTKEIAGPVSRLEMGPQGAIYITAEKNLTRGAGADRLGVTKQTGAAKMWSPHELTNFDERAHFWVAADDLALTHSDGDPVETWNDLRFSNTKIQNGGPWDNMRDTTVRNLTRPLSQTAPTFIENAVGGKPAVRFEAPNNCLISDKNTNAVGKSGQQQPAPTQGAVFPGYAGSIWASFWVFRPVTNTTTPQILASQKDIGGGGNAQDYAIVVDAEVAGGGTPSAGTRLISAEGNVGVDFHPNPTAGGDGGASDAAMGTYSIDGEASRAVLLTVLHIGDDAAGSVVRVNGREVDEFTLGGDENYDGTASPWGGRTVIGASPSDASAMYNGNHDGFSGDLCEILTVLANHDGVGINDGSITNFLSPGGFGDWRCGFTSQLAASEDADFATEVERIEGYLAHKWGLSELLPNGYTDVPYALPTDTTSAFQNHPFGGPGAYPIGNTSVLGETTLAISRRERGEFSIDQVLTKYKAGTASLAWTLAGGGLGLSVGVDPDGHAIGYGGFQDRVEGFLANIPYRHVGPSRDIDDETTGNIARKILDEGEVGRIGRKAFGFVRLQVNPTDGDQVVIPTASSGDVTYTFRNAPVGSYDVQIDGGGDRNATAVNFRDAINGNADSIEAEWAGFYQVRIISTIQGSSGNGDITDGGGWAVTDPEVIGMTGGLDANGAWLLGDNMSPVRAGVPLRVDMDGDWYVGVDTNLDWTNVDTTDVVQDQVEKRDGTDGSIMWSFDVDSADVGTKPYAIAPFATQPNYGSGSSIRGPEFMYVGTDGGSLASQPDDVFKVRTVDAEQVIGATESPRATVDLAVIDGRICTFDGPTVTEVSTPATRLQSDSPYVQSAELFSKVYWTDGFGYRVYDPEAGTLEEFTSADAGEIPKHSRLIAAWGGRLLLIGDDRHTIHMSQMGDPANWDLDPPVLTAIDAFSGAAAPIGQTPDLINTLIPYSDDLLIVGCDHSIQRFTGDPTAGGRLDLVSDTTGMLFGAPWAKDELGRLFFFGSRGALYLLGPDGAQCISDERLERRLRDIDFANYTIRMAWDVRERGLRIHAIPYAATAGEQESWFLDSAGSYWEDSYTSRDVQSTAMAVRDADDPGDRVVLIGCEDGKVRYFSEESFNDVGTPGAAEHPIDSYVTMGPLMPGEAGHQTRFSHVEVVLGAQQQGARVDLFATDTAEFLGNPVSSWSVGPGRNPLVLIRARGSAVYARIGNAARDERWAFESLSLLASAAGRKVVR